ncbi:MAG TPA: carboxypeptidase regulatory-like domain-containing protein [Luteitalea sp.]|nr:carboxypeptidase regulatory-like domain-containing protein [Luteitalea sp.]
MSIRVWLHACLFVLVLGAGVAPVFAQEDPAAPNARTVAATGHLVVTARDTLEGRLPGATVRVEAQGAATTTEAMLLVTDVSGDASVELTPGDYRVIVELPGFERVTVDVTVAQGQTARSVATLKLSGFAEQVAVRADEDTKTATTDGQTEVLTAEEIDNLPDDPEELALMLEALAGGEAEVRVNGFEGGGLPPKAQIQAVRIRRDPFSPDSMGGGRPRIEVVTRPGMTTWTHEVNVGFRDQSIDARQAFAPARGTGQTRRLGYNFSGPLIANKASISGRIGYQDSFEAEAIVAQGAPGVFPGLVNRERGRIDAELRVEHAVNQAHTLRAEYQRRDADGDNLGVGEFNLAERAYSEDVVRDVARLSAMSTLGKRWFNELRFEYADNRERVDSVSDGVIVNVQNAFVSGGAQRRGGRREREIEIADSIDLLGSKRHTLRAGFEAEFGWSRSDRIDNYAGTFTFASLEDFQANRPRQYTLRTGDPLVTYDRQEISWFVHDEITLSDRVRLGLGVRHDVQSLVDEFWNVAPRISVSFTPVANGPTTYTAGIGVFNDWYAPTIFEQTLQLDGTRQRDLIVRDPAFPDPFGGNGSIETPPPSIIREDGDIDMQTSQRLSVGVEHRFTRQVRVQLNVFGQLTGDRLRSYNANAPLDGALPDPSLNRVTAILSNGRARSAGFDSNLRVSSNGGRTSGLIRYRYAQAWNDADGPLSLPADSRDLDAEWGPSSGDVRHRFYGFVRTQFPYGVRANVWADVQSGAPYTVRTGFDDNRDTIFNDRPFGVGRNTERGTWQRTVNLRLGWQPGSSATGDGRGGRGGGATDTGRPSRAARRGVELYAQVWNLLNEVNFTRFAGVLTSPLYGQATAAAPARRFDFGTRVFF